MRNSLTLLNENGDTSIAWDEENDEKMIALIKQKMKEGMTFFVIEPRFFNLLPMRVRATNETNLKKNRQVFLADKDFNDLIINGVAKPYKRETTGQVETVGMLTKAEDAKGKHLVGIGQRKGG